MSNAWRNSAAKFARVRCVVDLARATLRAVQCADAVLAVVHRPGIGCARKFLCGTISRNKVEIPEDIMTALREFTPRRRWSRIRPEARLLHDLVVTGDEFHSLVYRIDPETKIDFTNLYVDDFIPSELSWDALLVVVLSRFGLEHVVTRRYKELLVSDLLRMRRGGT